MKRIFLCSMLLIAVLLCSCQSQDGGKWYDFSLSEYITLGEYKNLKVSPVAPEAVTDEAVEEEIRRVLEAHSSSEILSEGVYQEGDEIKMDFEGVFEGEIKRSSRGYTTAIGAKGSFDDFEGGLSSLIGLPIQDKHVLNLTYKADAIYTDWAGKTLEFTLNVLSVTRYHKAVLDDEFVRSLGGEEQTVEQYRSAVREKLQRQAEQSAHEAELLSVWSSALSLSKMKLYPQNELNGYVTYFKELYAKQAEELGMAVEDFMMLYYGIDSEQILADAKAMVKQDLLLYSIAEKEGITLSAEEYSRFAAELCAQKGLGSVEELEALLTKRHVEKAALLARVQEALLSWAELPSAPSASVPASSSAA